MKVLKSFLLNTLLVLMSTAFIIFIAEVFVRVLFNQQAYTVSLYPKALFDYSSPTNLSPEFKGQFPKSEVSGNILINSKGLRDHERPYEKRNIVRILGLGDSFAFGHGVEFEESFLYILEENLQSIYGQHIEVIKAGTPGIGPQKYLSILKSEGLKYSPDVVLVCIFIGNDINDIAVSNIKSAETKNTTAIKNTEVTNTLRKDKEVNNLKTYLRRNIHLYSFIVDRIKTIPIFRETLQKTGIGSGLIGTYVIDVLKKEYTHDYLAKWDEAFNVLTEIHELSDSLIVVLIPTREQVYPDRLEKAVKQLGYSMDDIDIMHPNNKLIRFCELNNIRCIDLLPYFSENATNKMLYFDIDPHFNVTGNKLAADILTKKISEDLHLIFKQNGNN